MDPVTGFMAGMAALNLVLRLKERGAFRNRIEEDMAKAQIAKAWADGGPEALVLVEKQWDERRQGTADFLRGQIQG